MTSIYVKEKAAQGTPTATYGQIWVENTVPASWHIEDDAGALAEVNVGTLIATTLTGTLSTAAQTNITSVGTLTSLAVSGAFSCGALTSTGIDDNATSEKLQLGDTRLDSSVPIFIAEQAAAATNVAGFAQLWNENSGTGVLHVDGDDGAQGAVASGSLNLGTDSATKGYINIYGTNYPSATLRQYGANTNNTYLRLHKNRGTVASPAGLSVNDILGVIDWQGYNATPAEQTPTAITVTATATTGNLEPTMALTTGTSGAMSLFADGHLEVYGAGGATAQGWSHGATDAFVIENNASSVGMNLVCTDGTAAYVAYGMSDSGTSGDWSGGILCYAQSHATLANFIQIYGSGDIELATGATNQINLDAGAVLWKTGETVANLATPTPSVGMVARVTDASSPSVGSTVTGGGGAAALVWYNGSNWTVIGV